MHQRIYNYFVIKFIIKNIFMWAHHLFYIKLLTKIKIMAFSHGCKPQKIQRQAYVMPLTLKLIARSGSVFQTLNRVQSKTSKNPLPWPSSTPNQWAKIKNFPFLISEKLSENIRFKMLASPDQAKMYNFIILQLLIWFSFHI